MQVFISFSGDISHKTAQALEWWLPKVLQAVKPFLSSANIDKGARWGNELTQILAQCDYGIICLTRTNLNAPWINYETGALSKSFETSRVSPLLMGLKKSEVRPSTPLGQFQLTSYTQEDIKHLITTINNGTGAQAVSATDLNEIFTVWWPTLQERLDPIDRLAEQETEEPAQSISVPPENLLEELLELARDQRRAFSTLEKHLSQLPAQANALPIWMHQALVEARETLADTVTNIEDDFSISSSTLTTLVNQIRLADRYIHSVIEKDIRLLVKAQISKSAIRAANDEDRNKPTQPEDDDPF